MTKEALEQRVTDLENEVESLKLMVEEARIVADAKRNAADEMERRLTSWMGKQMWAAQA